MKCYLYRTVYLIENIIGLLPGFFPYNKIRINIRPYRCIHICLHLYTAYRFFPIIIRLHVYRTFSSDFAINGSFQYHDIKSGSQLNSGRSLYLCLNGKCFLLKIRYQTEFLVFVLYSGRNIFYQRQGNVSF